MERKVAAASSLFASLSCGSSFQKTFSKATFTSIGDKRCGKAKSKPRHRANFWKNDNLYEDRLLMCSSMSFSLQRSLEIFFVWLFIKREYCSFRRASIVVQYAGNTENGAFSVNLFVYRVTFFRQLVVSFYFLTKFLCNDIFFKGLRWSFPFRGFCTINSCEGWCQPKVLTKFQEFNSGVATDLFFTTLFQTLGTSAVWLSRFKIRSNKFLLKHLVIKISDRKYERRFDRSTVIFKLRSMK